MHRAFSNIDEAEYSRIIHKCSGVKKKADIIAKLKTLGFTAAGAVRFYELVYKSKK